MLTIWRFLASSLAVAVACSGALAAAAAEGGDPSPGAAPAAESQFVALEGHAYGLLWSPRESGPSARIGVVVLHPFVSAIDFAACAELAARGYHALCANGPTTNRQFGFGGYEAQAGSIRAAVQRMRAQPGVERVVLIGHGAGAAMMAFYQNVATNGASVCSGPEKIVPCDAARLEGLLPADGLVMLDPRLGQAFELLSHLDPAIASEDAATLREPAYDMFDPRNGFDPGRNAGDYSTAFRKTFHDAQAARNARILEDARKALTAIVARDRGSFSDDMPLFIPGAQSARIWESDTGLLARTKRSHKLLRADGTAPRRQLKSLALPSGNPREATSFRASVQLSVRQYLSGFAIETKPDYDVTEDDIQGVVWASSATSAIDNVAGLKVPLLIMAMTGHILLRPAEMIWEAAPGPDKELVGVEGAGHWFAPCGPCEAKPGQFGDTVKRTFDYVDEWLKARFAA